MVKQKKQKNLTIMIVENFYNRSCGRNVCIRVDVDREREDISEFECLVVSGIIHLNDYGVLIGRGESRGEGQADWFYTIARRGSRPL